MIDHSHYEELAALEAGGFLTDTELIELREHTKDCLKCQNADEEFSELARFGLPQTVSSVREFVDKMKAKPDDGMRGRFLQRARFEGVVFSPEIEGSIRHPGRRVGFVVASVTVLATVILAAAFYGPYLRPTYRESLQAQQEVDDLKRKNTALTASVSQLNQSLAEEQRQIQNLRAELGNATTTAENLRRNAEQARGEAERSTSQNVQLLDESRDQEKLLSRAKDEAARANALRANDEASLVAEMVRVAELTDKLRIASATLDMERQLAATGQDVRELMAARQLHVIDVRDADQNGQPGKAFGRVFLTEGKSLTFYAFDLNEDHLENSKLAFQV